MNHLINVINFSVTRSVTRSFMKTEVRQLSLRQARVDTGDITTRNAAKVSTPVARINNSITQSGSAGVVYAPRKSMFVTQLTSSTHHAHLGGELIETNCSHVPK